MGGLTMMRYKCNLLLFGLLCVMFVSCRSAPVPVDPDELPPEQEALDMLDAAMTRAQNARAAALLTEGNVFFPDEWRAAEAHNDAGRRAGRDTVGAVNAAIASFTAAAQGYEDIAERSAPLYTQALEDARLALEAAIARTGQSRSNALANQGPVHFPDEWEAAENLRQRGEEANTDTLAEINAALALLSSAADAYDDIAERSRPMEEANLALQAALARAEQSRSNAQGVQANTFFPEEWAAAEAELQAARDTDIAAMKDIESATALFISAADMYDDIAGRSRTILAEREAAQRAAAERTASEQAAAQRAAADRAAAERAAADRAAAERAAAERAAAERAAAAERVAATEANRELQNAMNRAQQSRRQAMDAQGQTHFPNEWRTAEGRNTTAQNARRTTAAEMRAAVPLFNSAADAYDDITRRSIELSVATARANAEAERQAAIDVRAPIAVPDDFGSAETVYQQGLREQNTRAFPAALASFNQATSLFAAAARLTMEKYDLADDAVTRARQRSAASTEFAITTGRAMDGITEEVAETMEEINE